MGNLDSKGQKQTVSQKNAKPVEPVKKKYTTPGPHLDEIDDSAETRAAMNEEMPSPVPRKDH